MSGKNEINHTKIQFASEEGDTVSGGFWKKALGITNSFHKNHTNTVRTDQIRIEQIKKLENDEKCPEVALSSISLLERGIVWQGCPTTPCCIHTQITAYFNPHFWKPVKKHLGLLIIQEAAKPWEDGIMFQNTSKWYVCV